MFIGQRVCWAKTKTEEFVRVDRERAIEELGESIFGTEHNDTDPCDATMHTFFAAFWDR